VTPSTLTCESLAVEAITKHGAQQKVAELTALLELLRGREIDSVLEIGSWTGGTLWLWAQIAKYVVSIDLETRGPALGVLPAPVERILGDSHLQSTKARLGSRLFTMLFLDGGHTYEDIKRDYEMGPWRTARAACCRDPRPAGVVPRSCAGCPCIAHSAGPG
jgi:hypothetical protein